MISPIGKFLIIELRFEFIDAAGILDKHRSDAVAHGRQLMR